MNFYAREQERTALQREQEERAKKEREARRKASRRLALYILGEADAGGSEEDTTAQDEAGTATTSPTPSADAGARGLEPQKRESPAEQLAAILLHNQGVPDDPWR